MKPDDITDGEFENAHYAYSEYGAGLIAALAAQNALRDRRVVEEAIGTTHVCECCEERTTRPYVHPEEGIDLCAPCVAALPREEPRPDTDETGHDPYQGDDELAEAEEWYRLGRRPDTKETT